ncbi:Mobile element protein [Lactiplantibacillus plantarum]|uniref:IS3 family transposase n=1 Tax=Lactiplantibacillus plantarum TaxID=1590 RepID=UPI0007BB6ECE|nr:IS3 family transposase [Lactiplantibacillus plantarum]KZU32011.1 Mobile element protein [Lactiplantibacillus plantarum]KZU75837.1 Mobile element protein [Lactiplantibacillus plantarum]
MEEVKTHELIELVDELRPGVQTPIKLVLKAVHIPRSTYYYVKEHRGRDLDDSQIIQAIEELRQQDPKYTRKYGYRRITDVLHGYGFKINHKRVYLEPILDLFNGEVLAFNISDHPTVEFAVKTLKKALNQIPVLDYRTTVHTDQEFQY